MKVLAIDTTEEGCSAALYLDGEVSQRFEHAPRRHSELILPMMEQLLVEAGLKPVQLDGLAFARGPGAFTGVRIASAVTQGVALAADLPVAPVSSLRALAQRARRQLGAERVLAAFDARMNELYWAACAADGAGQMQLCGQEQVLPADALALPAGNGWVGVGSGWQAYDETLAARMPDVSVHPGAFWNHAWDVATLGASLLEAGNGVAAEQALPVYLRDQVAWKKVAS